MNGSAKLTLTPIDAAHVPGGQFVARWAGGEFDEVAPKLDPDDPSQLECDRRIDRPAAVGALTETNRRYGNELSTQTRQALGEDAVLVIGGQQPGLLTGPGYAIHKAMTIIRLARELSEQHGVKVLPAFWLATEDHDVDEVNRCWLGERRFVVHHDQVGAIGPRPPVGQLTLEPHREAIQQFVADALHDAPHRDDVMDLLAASDFSNYGTLCATLLRQLLAPHEIVFVDPFDLRGPASPVLAEIVEQWDGLSEALQTGGKLLSDRQVTPPLDAMHLFEFVEGRRRRIDFNAGRFELHDGSVVAGELAKRIIDQPDRFSPSAALRPIVQDTVLPTIVTVGGPSELAYLWQIDPLYQCLGRKRSRLASRFGATVVDGETLARAGRFGVEPAAIFDAASMYENFDPAKFDPGPKRLATIEQQTHALLDQLAQLDMGKQQKLADRAGRSIRYQVDRVARRLRNDRLAQRGMDKSVLHSVVRAIMPAGGLQERVQSPLVNVARLGRSFYPSLLEAMPSATGHYLASVAGA